MVTLGFAATPELGHEVITPADAADTGSSHVWNPKPARTSSRDDNSESDGWSERTAAGAEYLAARDKFRAAEVTPNWLAMNKAPPEFFATG
jgi:hypothetical protein